MMMSIFPAIFSEAEKLDKELFVCINRSMSAPWLDPIMLLLRHPLTWAPLYIWLAGWSFKKMPTQFWWFVGLSVFTFAITDIGSSQWLKPLIGRIRPCYDPGLTDVIRPLISCGGPNSMPSNHASNHFGLAMFWFCSIREVTGRKWRWLWLWAFSIGYAQVYVSKHFPGDILAGAVVGVLTGWLTFSLFRYACSRMSAVRQPVHAPGEDW
jgi:undecaprenyl-diphosphatase